MNSAVQGIHHNAIKHSQRAARLWRESAAIFDGISNRELNRLDGIRKASELNRKALDECQQALRSIEFLARYRECER